MAEFAEVMKQAQRLCEMEECRKCPLHNFSAGDCMMTLCYSCENSVAYGKVEKIITQWAKENPEPVYPSWKEWHDKTFPNARTSVNPCWFITGNPADCNRMECVKCRNRPIPAEIAKKLGIQPKEQPC